MKQTRLQSLLESWGNTVLGFVGSMIIQWGICWWWSLPLQTHDNLIIIGIFTAWSLGRNYGYRRLMERFRISRPLTSFMQAVIAEVYRQQESEGFDAAHDDAHPAGELAAAGAAYLLGAGKNFAHPPACWPWDGWWNPKDVRRDLVRGCALGIAEGNRFERVTRRRGKA